MIIKFNAGEPAELNQYAGEPFGEENFCSFMAEVCARTDEGTGEVDLDRDDYERIETHQRQGHGEVLDKVFKRPLDKAFKKFVGRPGNSRSRAPRTRL